MGSADRFPPEQGTLPPEFPATLHPTGEAAVDELLIRLPAIPGLPESDQAAAYERLHDQLLSELDVEHG